MNSAIINVSEILSNAKNFSSAGFSVGYSFDKNKAAEYFDELLRNSTFSSPIFSGILIFKQSQDRIDEFTIIDGLQRLTTISLLLCALCEAYKGTSQNNEDARSKIFNRYLVNNNIPKLNLTGEDNNIYKKILFSEWLIDKEVEHNLVQTYQGFLDKIKQNRISGTELFKILSKIQFMIVITDDVQIPVRDLYQVLNQSKNESQVNLIYDFIEHKDKSSIVVWEKIIESFGNKKYLLENFIKDFLMTRTNEEINNKNALYNNFRNYYYQIAKYQDTKTIIDNIYKYAKYYLKILNADFDTPEIKEQITILNEHNAKEAYPYLMEVLDDLENDHINKGAFINILMMINLFIKSQQETSFANVNIDFTKLSKELNKMLIIKDYVPNLMEQDKLTINMINNLSDFEVQ